MHPILKLLELYFRFVVWIWSHFKVHKEKLVKTLIKVKEGLGQETVETKEMLDIYYRFGRGQATEEEMEKANHQFRDILRTMGLGVFAALPMAPISIPLLVKIGRKLGVEILPSSFNPDKKTTPVTEDESSGPASP